VQGNNYSRFAQGKKNTTKPRQKGHICRWLELKYQCGTCGFQLLCSIHSVRYKTLTEIGVVFSQTCPCAFVVTNINPKPIWFRSDACPAPAAQTSSEATAPALTPPSASWCRMIPAAQVETPNPQVRAGHGMRKTPCQHELDTVRARSLSTSEVRKRLTAESPVSQFAEEEIWV